MAQQTQIRLGHVIRPTPRRSVRDLHNVDLKTAWAWHTTIHLPTSWNWTKLSLTEAILTQNNVKLVSLSLVNVKRKHQWWLRRLRELQSELSVGKIFVHESLPGKFFKSTKRTLKYPRWKIIHKASIFPKLLSLCFQMN